MRISRLNTSPTTAAPRGEYIARSDGGRLAATDCPPIAQKPGAARVFTKPIAREAMAAAIRELLRTGT